MVQLSHLYMTIGKTIALTIGTFVCKVRTYRKRKFDYEMEVSDHTIVVILIIKTLFCTVLCILATSS